jgi:hypothetical protein
MASTSTQRPSTDRCPVWVEAIWPSRRPLRPGGSWCLPPRLARARRAAEVIRMVGSDKDVAVLADHRPAREWEQAGATWWLQRRARSAVSDLEALVEAGPPGD